MVNIYLERNTQLMIQDFKLLHLSKKGKTVIVAHSSQFEISKALKSILSFSKIESSGRNTFFILLKHKGRVCEKERKGEIHP